MKIEIRGLTKETAENMEWFFKIAEGKHHQAISEGHTPGLKDFFIEGPFLNLSGFGDTIIIHDEMAAESRYPLNREDFFEMVIR
jgi:hypothetical protein